MIRDILDENKKEFLKKNFVIDNIKSGALAAKYFKKKGL